MSRHGMKASVVIVITPFIKSNYTGKVLAQASVPLHLLNCTISLIVSPRGAGRPNYSQALDATELYF